MRAGLNTKNKSLFLFVWTLRCVCVCDHGLLICWSSLSAETWSCLVLGQSCGQLCAPLTHFLPTRWLPRAVDGGSTPMSGSGARARTHTFTHVRALSQTLSAGKSISFKRVYQLSIFNFSFFLLIFLAQTWNLLRWLLAHLALKTIYIFLFYFIFWWGICFKLVKTLSKWHLAQEKDALFLSRETFFWPTSGKLKLKS